jgi:LacI family transcriptional regulator
MADAAERTGVPLVNLWLNSPVLERIPSVVADCEAAGVIAGEHLLGRGLRSFGYLGSRRQKDADLQFEGFRETVTQAGFRCTSYRFPHKVMEGDALLWEKFEKGLGAWVDTSRPPVGVFVYQDVFCRLLIDICTAKGLSVPGDVAIVGCLDDTIICEACPPSLTSIDMGHERRGYQAAALLDRLMKGGKAPDSPLRVAPARLVLRESSDVFAASDPLVARALRYIVAHGERMVEVPEVAKAVGVSRRTLERKFQESVGHSIATEMVRLRLNRAKRRLVMGDVLLKTVAEESGFRTASHFSRVFTRVLGITPSAYQAEHSIQAG